VVYGGTYPRRIIAIRDQFIRFICWTGNLTTPCCLFERTVGICQDGSSDGTGAPIYSDGSIEKDLPMEQLAELFNVNHFIISQVSESVSSVLLQLHTSLS